MNLITIRNGISAAYNVSKMYLKDHAPQILLGVAIGSEIGAIGTSCYAMTKMDDILEKHKNRVDEAKKLLESKVIDDEKYQEMITKTYIDTGLNSAKYWSLPVALTALSITAGLSAYGIVNKKYVGAMAGLADVTNKFRCYRDNVVEDVGPERDEIYLNDGIYKAKLARLGSGNEKNGQEEPYTDDEINKAMYSDNPEKLFTVKKEEALRLCNHPYCFEYSIDTVRPGSFNEHDHMYNVYYLTNYLVSYWNAELVKRGVIPLNDVLDSIGLDIYKSAEFYDIGWCLKKYDARCDGFIDFGFDKDSVANTERKMWKEPTAELRALFNSNPDAARVMLVMNCCDIRLAKKRLYGEYFGPNGKMSVLKNV